MAEAYKQTAAFSLFLSMVVFCQWLSQAYITSFGEFPDEPGHYLTAVMIRDYILSGFSGSPLAFAERYYVHYPAITFGIWGPVFDLVGALWMLVFSESRVSVMALIAIIAAGFAWSAQWMIGHAFGRPRGILAGVAICLISAFQVQSSAVMVDLLTGTLIMWAAYSWSRYLETERRSWALRFGVLAALALLTKVNAGVLALLPIPAALLAGRANLLRRRDFWIPAAMVALITGPWYAVFVGLARTFSTVTMTPAIAFSYIVSGLGLFGTALIPIVIAGMAAGFFKKGRLIGSRPLWAVAVSMSVGFIAYYCLIPARFEQRYILMVAPWIAYLSIVGAEWIAAGFAPSPRGAISTALLAAIVIYGVARFHVDPKPSPPYAELAYDLVCRRNLPQTIFLVSSEATVETTFVAEIAMRDRRPNHFVLRASKMLARMTWGAEKYESRVANEAQVRDFLRAMGVSIVIIDTTPSVQWWPHHHLLRSVVAADPQWRLTRRYGPVELYEFQGVVKMPEVIRVEVPYTLHRTLEATRTGK
jgi:hypothetical protein